MPHGAKAAIVVPARIGQRLASVQLIWANGTKRFLYGGDMGGAAHRIATGGDTWLCEGYATGLSLRLALKGLNRRDTVLVCFSAANIAKVASVVRGRCFIAADHDAPPKAKPDQFGGLGAGEHFARKAERPYLMPPAEGMDVNDLHQEAGIFEVQRLISMLIRGEGRP
ncbi:toprim domain-containing protein [Devosia sp.]|uniref:toprim domain-containing protein n=1 Tax=Devosia sp. TaxID=1871048 RepID=UPI002605049D|nr:toprim domain-containing protein [Devosia sp.]